MTCKVKDVMRLLEKEFPLYLAQEWDNVGLQLGDRNQEVRKLCVALDLTHEVLDQAIQEETDLIITHHPLFFRGINHIDYAQPRGRLIQRLIQAGISVYSAHTNLDAGENGLNQYLAERLGLDKIALLDQDQAEAYQKLVVYVPAGHEEEVRAAICGAGGGFIGEYSDCSFRVLGTGTFLPGQATNPFIGQQGVLEQVEEYRLETIIPARDAASIIQRMQAAHPYEEVAYDLFPLANQHQHFSLGRTGSIQPMKLAAFASHVKQRLNIPYVRVVGDLEQEVSRVAVVSGAGASFIRQARSKRCDVLVTGDLKYHEAMTARELGLAVIDAGHYGTEHIVVDLLKKQLENKGLEIELISALQQDCLQIV